MVGFGTTVTVRDRTFSMKIEDSEDRDRRSLMLYGKTATEEIGLDWNGSKYGGEASFFRRNEDGEIATDLKMTFDEIEHLWKTMRSWFRGKLVENDDVTSESTIEEVEANTKADGNVASELPTQEGDSSTGAGTTLAATWYVPLHQIPKPWARPKTNEVGQGSDERR